MIRWKSLSSSRLAAYRNARTRTLRFSSAARRRCWLGGDRRLVLTMSLSGGKIGYELLQIVELVRGAGERSRACAFRALPLKLSLGGAGAAAGAPIAGMLVQEPAYRRDRPRWCGGCDKSALAPGAADQPAGLVRQGSTAFPRRPIAAEGSPWRRLRLGRAISVLQVRGRHHPGATVARAADQLAILL